jgi:hypothetical protein
MAIAIRKYITKMKIRVKILLSICFLLCVKYRKNPVICQ